jgi:hypothetical protein
MTYRIADTTTVTAGTGTLSSSGVNLTGAGGSVFLTELASGKVIHAAGQTLVIDAVTTDSAATVVTAPVVALSTAAFTITNMLAVASLVSDSSDPLGDFVRWVDTKSLGNGLARSVGRPLASWLWKNIGVAHRTALSNFCTGKSARVYICTLKDPNTNAFATYQAVMLWPDDDDTYKPDFVIRFRDLVAL